MSIIVCPKCGSDLIWGHEVRGFYDGILYWRCTPCAWAWSAWSHHDNSHRAHVASTYVDAINSATADQRAASAATGAGDGEGRPAPVSSDTTDREE